MLLTWVIGSLIVGILGMRTTIGFWGFFFMSLFLSPIFGFFVVIVGNHKRIPKYFSKEELVEVEIKKKH